MELVLGAFVERQDTAWRHTTLPRVFSVLAREGGHHSES